ncbi:MAG: gliding motility-associated C-terminal domain-containing protein, partial [Bacteroidales bacterium]|nr:gliding motility-associated C-terminal domain-containing protein [Bacteroidales bacterium]
LVAYNDLDCSDTLNFSLPVTQFTFYAPNAFTPERPDNNTFSIFTANEQENFVIFIYDRNGRQVYHSEDLHFKWDGNSDSGIKCPQGTYVYVIYYRRPGTEDIVNQKGTITLIR